MAAEPVAFAGRVGKVVLAADLHERTTHGVLPSTRTGLAGALAVRRGGRPGRGPGGRWVWFSGRQLSCCGPVVVVKRCPSPLPVAARPSAWPWSGSAAALRVLPIHHSHHRLGAWPIGLGLAAVLRTEVAAPVLDLGHRRCPAPPRHSPEEGAPLRPKSSRLVPTSEAFLPPPDVGSVVAAAGVLLPVAGRVGSLPGSPSSASEGAIAFSGVSSSPRTSDLAPDAMRSRHLRAGRCRRSPDGVAHGLPGSVTSPLTSPNGR